MTGKDKEMRDPVIGTGLESVSRGGAPSRALFLDRDGVINMDHGYVCSVRRTDFVTGIFDLVGAAIASNYLVIVVTNQAGIGKGYYSEQRFLRYTRWMHAWFERKGSPLAATYYCPHRPDDNGVSICNCRKPEPGMFVAAAQKFRIDMAHSIMLGDKSSDIQAAISAGVGSALLVEEGQLPRLRFQ